jgi:lipid A 3-O-deacylase
MKRTLLILTGSCLALTEVLSAATPALLSIGAGTFDTLRPGRRMAQLQVDYLWSACWYGVRPVASAFVTHKGALYFCFGAAYEIPLGRHFLLIPSFAPGIYLKNKGKDLGCPLEFRSCLNLSYVRENCDRISLQFYHISNASIGYKNPGEESLILSYGFAL